jgi:sulfate permease, SulP family
VTGLYAATLPLVVYALLGSSGQLAVGPVAIVALLTASAVAPHADTAGEAVAVAGLLAAMVGVLQLALGLARLGRVADVLTHPVIVGFTSAAAIIIALSQLRELLGIDAAGSDTALAAVAAVAGRIEATHMLTLVVGTAAILLLLTAQRITPRVPGPLVLLVAVTALSALLGFGERGVAIVGDIPSGLPAPSLPLIDGGLVLALAPAAVAIAFISFAEGLSVARAVARDTGDTISSNRELVAVGAANAAAATVQAFPVAGGFSRTAVSHQAGARTPLAGLLTAGLIAAVAVALTPLLFHLPRAALGAVIVVAVLRLVDLPEIRRLLRADLGRGAVAGVTFVATLALGVEPGLAVGVLAGLVLRIRRRRDPAGPTPTDQGAAVGADEAARRLPEADAAREITDGPPVTVIDVRTPREYAAGHVAGAALINVQDPDFRDRVDQLDRDGRYRLYCRSGNRSGHAAKVMADMGFADVANIGGFERLAAGGAPTER